MPTVVNLRADIESRLITEAARVGVTPDRLVADLLDRQLAADRRAEAAEAEAEAAQVAADRRAATIALLNSWITVADPTDQQETLDALIQGLDANRTGQRQLFPPEAKGRTW